VEANADFQTLVGLIAEESSEELTKSKKEMEERRDQELERLGKARKRKEVATKELDAFESKAAKARGARESGMFHMMTELGIRLEPYQGDMTMNGPNSLKFIKEFPKLASLLDDGDTKDNFLILFDSLHILVGYLFTTAPLRYVDFSQEEWESLEGPMSTPEQLASDLKFLEEHCHFHGNFFKLAFMDIPPPKHHFAVFHVSQFAWLFGSLGMFAEQGMERSHSTSNTLNRKLRPIADPKKLLERKFVEYAAKASMTGRHPKFVPMSIHDRN